MSDTNIVTSTNMDCDENERMNLLLPWLTYDKYFEMLKQSENGKNILVKCKLCVGNSKPLSTSKISSSNLKKHLKAKHNIDINKSMDTRITAENINKRALDEDDVSKKNKQLSIINAFSQPPTINQEVLDTMITEFVIMGNHPFSIVEEVKFRDIIAKGFPKRKCIYRKTLMHKISTIAINMRDSLKNKLTSTSVKYVCVTTDGWSVYKRSYIGMTVHWFNYTTLLRESAVLACKRIKGRHTYDVITKMICKVFCEYGITNKVTRVVTDNGSNFVKAFRVFGSVMKTAAEVWLDQIEHENDNSDDSDGDEDAEDGIEVIELDSILNNTDDQDIAYSLPPHHRCASHTLNLVATKDSENALSNVLYKKQARSTFGKMQVLWNKQDRSSQVADEIHDSLNKYIQIPNMTRWNSTFRAVQCLKDQLKKDEEKVLKICDVANIPRFDKKDRDFMTDYCIVMEPLVKALDILQGDKSVCMGYLLPTINWLSKQLEELSLTGGCCKALAAACAQGVEKRFKNMKKDSTIILAAVSHPKFKLRWLSGDEKKEANDLLQLEIDATPNFDNNDEISSKLPQGEDEFLFNDEDVEEPYPEIERFIKAPYTSDLTMLNSMTIVKDIFIKYNTALPSSASVERLFSVAGDICSKKRSRMSDKNFEDTLFCKVNLKTMNK